MQKSDRQDSLSIQSALVTILITVHVLLVHLILITTL